MKVKSQDYDKQCQNWVLKSYYGEKFRIMRQSQNFERSQTFSIKSQILGINSQNIRHEVKLEFNC